jgi:hypothetical protein
MPTPTRFRTKLPVLGVLALALVVTLAIAIPTDTSASHDFNDVPDSMIFHEEVSRIKDAGITTGCGGGNYCPWDPVSRLAMAAFMNRGFGRAAMDNTLLQDAINDSDSGVDIGEVTIDVPGAGSSATQFVEVRGQVAVLDIDGVCSVPCAVLAQLVEPAGPVSYITFDAIFIGQTIEISWVFAATPGPHTYQLWLATVAAPADVYLGSLALTATTYPFGAGGTDVLSPAAAGSASLDAATLGDGRPSLGDGLDGSSLKDVLEGLRSKRP